VTPLLSLVMAARGTNRVPGEPRKKRVVARFSKADIARVDAIRKHLPRTSRAQVIRAFVLYGLAMLDTQTEAPSPAPVGEAAP
jgi:hypothetical protein